MEAKKRDDNFPAENTGSRHLRRARERLFYNQPEADADFAYWGKMDCWGVEEAVALSFGKDPNVVMWNNSSKEKSVECYTEMDDEFAGSYGRRREIVLNAVRARYLTDPVLSLTFIHWAQSKQFELPIQLVQQVESSCPSPAPTAPVDQAQESKPVSRRLWQESRMLQTIEKLGYDAKALPKNPQGKRGVKAEVRKELESDQRFTLSIFEKTWENLSKEDRIQYQQFP